MENIEIGIKISTLIYTIINFAILLLILKHFFWDKLKGIIESRQSEVEDMLAKADEDSEKARMYLVQNERILKEYIDYECNNYMDEWNFENWGIKYWSKTTEFIDYMEQH